MAEGPPQKKTSPWVYIGIGCLGLVVLIVGGVMLAGFFAYRWGKSLEEGMTDPKVRTAKVQKMLGAVDFPTGYNPAFTFSFAGLVQMAMLSDKPPDARGMIAGFDQRGFLYLRLPQSQDQNNVKDFIDGKRDDPGLRTANVDVYSKEVLKRGKLEVNGETVHYVVSRGEFRSQQVSHKGITSSMVVVCPSDTKTRVAFWFAPDPNPDKPLKEAELAGTPADEGAFKGFMGHFKLCTDS